MRNALRVFFPFFGKALIAVNWYLLVITVKLLAEICFVVQLNAIGVYKCECVDVAGSIRASATTPPVRTTSPFSSSLLRIFTTLLRV